MRITFTTVYDDLGKPVRAFGIGQNITAQKNAEARYEQAFRELAYAHPHTLGSFHLNLTRNWVGEGQSPLDFVLEQQKSGTVDGYFEEFSKLIADDGIKQWFFKTFDRKKLLDGFERGQTEVSFEYPIIYEDGVRHWREGLLYLILNPITGDVEGVTYAIDIDSRKYNELMAKALSSDIFGFMILLDMKTGKIITGGDTGDAASERYKDVDYQPAMKAALRKMMSGKTLDEAIAAHGIDNIRLQLEHSPNLEFSLITDDRRYLHWRIAYVDDEKSIVLITREDITDATRTEQKRIAELAEERRAHEHTNALLQSILDSVPTAMFWKDSDRRFEGANRAFLDFYGFDAPDAILGKNDEEMGWHPDPGPYKDDELKVIEDGISTHRVPGTCVSKGKLCHIVASKSPRYENGRIVGLVGSFEDVTSEFEQNEKIAALNTDLEKALATAEQANAAEQVFLSNMSHDMRTPLNGIIGFTDLALQSGDEAKREDYLKKIDISGHLMLDLVNDVLDLSKIESGKMELMPQSFDSRGLFDAIVDSMRLSAEKRGISFATEYDEAYPRFISADRLRLQQIVLNLLSNSIKYTPDGGEVHFAIRSIPAMDDGCNTLVTVTDTGIGMSKEFQRRMFDPFAQEHQSRMYGMQGTGLGLSIVKKIVDLMGGHIEVQSELGKGSAFRVYLPVEEVQVEVPAGQPHAAPGGDIAGMRILLCEDNMLNAEIAETILRERGHAEVETAQDGKAGFEKFSASKPGYYDAVLMDVRMPVMDGLEATRAIRALKRSDAATVPIIAMTADAFAEDAQNCMDAGMNAHVAKPIDPAKLISTLGGLCG